MGTRDSQSRQLGPGSFPELHTFYSAEDSVFDLSDESKVRDSGAGTLPGSCHVCLSRRHGNVRGDLSAIDGLETA